MRAFDLEVAERALGGARQGERLEALDDGPEGFGVVSDPVLEFRGLGEGVSVVQLIRTGAKGSLLGLAFLEAQLVASPQPRDFLAVRA
jgi:hypothetical protein